MTIAPSYHHATSNRRKRSLEEVSPTATSTNADHHHSNNQVLQPRNNKTFRSDFYLNRMDHRLQWALKCSREGNIRMMDFYLSQAKKDALQSQSYGETFLQWEAWIRGQLEQQIC